MSSAEVAVAANSVFSGLSFRCKNIFRRFLTIFLVPSLDCAFDHGGRLVRKRQRASVSFITFDLTQYSRFLCLVVFFSCGSLS